MYSFNLNIYFSFVYLKLYCYENTSITFIVFASLFYLLNTSF